MDCITHDIRRFNWLEILKRSQQRTAHTTIKQWCLDNGISEKSYYYCEYYGAAEPPVRCGESHLSGLTEPPQFVY